MFGLTARLPNPEPPPHATRVQSPRPSANVGSPRSLAARAPLNSEGLSEHPRDATGHPVYPIPSPTALSAESAPSESQSESLSEYSRPASPGGFPRAARRLTRGREGADSAQGRAVRAAQEVAAHGVTGRGGRVQEGPPCADSESAPAPLAGVPAMAAPGPPPSPPAVPARTSPAPPATRSRARPA
jgi:hypothetical protein